MILEEYEDNEVDLIILPPDNVDSLTDDEEINENSDGFKSKLPVDIAGTIEIERPTDITPQHVEESK